MSKQFYFKQSSLALVNSLVLSKNISISNSSVQHKYAVSITKTVLFQTIQFSMITQFSSIWPKDRTLSGATTPGQCGPETDGNKWVHRNPRKLQHYWNLTIRLFSVIFSTLVTLLQRSRSILQPQPTGSLDNRWGWSYATAKKSVYTSTLTDWARYKLSAWKMQVRVKWFAIFWFLLRFDVYITWSKQFKPWKVPAIFSSNI